MNKALDFARYGEEEELKSVGAFRAALRKAKTKEGQLQVMQMQIKIRRYVYRVNRPVPGAWLSGKKEDLLKGLPELKKLLEAMIKTEGKEIGRRPPRVSAAPERAHNPHADSITRELDRKYETQVSLARAQVGKLVAKGEFRAPRAGQPEKAKRKRKKKAVPVRTEANETEQALVARDAQFEDDGVLWQVYGTRWEKEKGVTLLYYDVERVKCRLADSEDELKDPEDLLSDDDDVERSSPAEVLAWVGAHERKGS